MTTFSNAKTLVNSLTAVSVNQAGEPIVTLTADPYLGKFILRQDLRISIGVPCMETTLHDVDSGARIYTARDEDASLLAEAKNVFNDIEYACISCSRTAAEARTRGVMNVLGFLGC